MSNPAAQAQSIATRPNVSTWLSANAGSGKTRVLTDRVARLLLGGTQPQNILCLTYTKAAATEMQNRLFSRLGAWAMLPGAALRDELTSLGEGAQLTEERLTLARQLFARAIETPGGLRIQTIHSFCAALLRRYPLEAGVSPSFTEMDERSALKLREEILQDMADRSAVKEFRDFAALHIENDLHNIISTICRNAPSFAAPLDRSAALMRFDLDPTAQFSDIAAQVFLGDEDRILDAVCAALAGSKSQAHIPRIRGLNTQKPDYFTLREMEYLFLFGANAKAPYAAKIDTYANKDVRAALGDMLIPFKHLMQRVEIARKMRLNLIAAEQTERIHSFARAFLPLYEARKEAQGLLDFDDLIRRANALLHDPSLAAWVLFRLDGGIDHILVDEAQDTSPLQWEVIARLTDEFTAGDGAREGQRTLFVVGDKKQSIFSFQGADLQAFDSKSAVFEANFAAANNPIQNCTLAYSFRSSKAVLDVVDATFGADFPTALGKDKPNHLPYYSDLPGRVELWPLIPTTSKPKDDDGWEPIDLISEDHHNAALAENIAQRIHDIIASGTQIHDRGKIRGVHAGDFLILVQRRRELFSLLIRACKQKGLPIAGADRLKLGQELVVKDILAFLSFLSMPEDSLALATALRSPLFGWSEQQLFTLAHNRESPHLWAALRGSDAPETLEIIRDMNAQRDYLRPYELIERILTRHNGRAKLLTRLGLEAEDAIDALLSQAILYEQTDVPSLTGFLSWLEGDEAEVKRQLGGENTAIRVMTVHGAKGLEANIVILPETCDRKAPPAGKVMTRADGLPIWVNSGGEYPSTIQDAIDAEKEKRREESLRLLYVALTRPRSWLIIAGAGEAKTDTKEGPLPREKLCWYRHVERGMRDLNAKASHDGGLVYQHGDWPEPRQNADTHVTAKSALPDWLSAPAPYIRTNAQPLTPSQLGGAKVVYDAQNDAEPDDAKGYGTALHSLLEHLPRHPPSDWDALALHLLGDDPQTSALSHSAKNILNAPELAPIFAPNSLAEVPCCGLWGDRAIEGIIDRLIVTPDHVLAIDYKSNRLIPQTSAQVPEGILRQMGAYAHILGQIYPTRRIETAILWTNTAHLMYLPPDIIAAALTRAASS